MIYGWRPLQQGANQVNKHKKVRLCTSCLVHWLSRYSSPATCSRSCSSSTKSTRSALRPGKRIRKSALSLRRGNRRKRLWRQNDDAAALKLDQLLPFPGTQLLVRALSRHPDHFAEIALGERDLLTAR